MVVPSCVPIATKVRRSGAGWWTFFKRGLFLERTSVMELILLMVAERRKVLFSFANSVSHPSALAHKLFYLTKLHS